MLLILSLLIFRSLMLCVFFGIANNNPSTDLSEAFSEKRWNFSSSLSMNWFRSWLLWNAFIGISDILYGPNYNSCNSCFSNFGFFVVLGCNLGLNLVDGFSWMRIYWFLVTVGRSNFLTLTNLADGDNDFEILKLLAIPWPFLCEEFFLIELRLERASYWPLPVVGFAMYLTLSSDLRIYFKPRLLFFISSGEPENFMVCFIESSPCWLSGFGNLFLWVVSPLLSLSSRWFCEEILTLRDSLLPFLDFLHPEPFCSYGCPWADSLLFSRTRLSVEFEPRSTWAALYYVFCTTAIVSLEI